MKFSEFATYLSEIEVTSSRLAITEKIAMLLKQSSPDEIEQLVYLMLGGLGPLYNRVEFHMSDKLMLKAVSLAFGRDEVKVMAEYKKQGDIGELVFALKNKGDGQVAGELSVGEVFDRLKELAMASGPGSQERKIHSMAKLINCLQPVSAKYLVRIPLGKLRLGFSDVTVLDALSVMAVGSKSKRDEIERAYNVLADIGRIARAVKTDGVEGLRGIRATPGVPIRPAAAERLPTVEAIIEKIGEVAVEPKIDGLRLQCHLDKKVASQGSSSEFFGDDSGYLVKLFSRNLEEMGEMFPEIVAAIEKLDVEQVIFEGEAVAFDPLTGKPLSFQETMQRRRKYGITDKAQELPLRLFAFDMLYLDGEEFIEYPYIQRRLRLAELIDSRDRVLSVVEMKRFRDAKKLSAYFNRQIENGLEGIMAKRLDAPYAAGARNFNWIKLKREEGGAVSDSIDCVVMGYKYGEGKRTKFGIGAFLVGLYDVREDKYRTVSNVGTGLTDDQWREMKERADKLRADSKPAQYDVPKELYQDVWIKPGMVVEFLADEITRWPLHTSGKRSGQPGYALRFPRLLRWRDDKRPEQATSVEEIKKIFNQQRGGKEK